MVPEVAKIFRKISHGMKILHNRRQVSSKLHNLTSIDKTSVIMAVRSQKNIGLACKGRLPIPTIFLGFTPP